MTLDMIEISENSFVKEDGKYDLNKRFRSVLNERIAEHLIEKSQGNVLYAS